MGVQVICHNCNKRYEVPKSFTPERRGSKHSYCSRECYDAYRMQPVTLKCEQCGSPFDVWKSRAERGNTRFCSKTCHNKWNSINLKGENNPNYQNGEQYPCETCGTLFYRPLHRKKVNARFCSSQCYGKWRELNGISAGENNPRYRDGSTMRTYERLRKAEWRRIANAIRDERGNRCENCGKTSSRYKFPVHHKVPWEVSHDDSPGNLMVVCRSCHPILDNEYWSSIETP